MGSEREQDLARTATAAASATAGAVDPVGETLGRYRLERELGAGAMGVVHAAFDPDLERRIALKVLRGATATLEAKDRLMREARAMARLNHPNVVTVFEVGTAAGRDFVAMELIHGEPLAEWLRATRRPAAAILDAFLAAGRGLAAAHAAGIVHRDFKPHNVLRSRDGRIVVTDFGLAREAQGSPMPALDQTLPLAGDLPPSALAGITVTGSLLGTPAYMAPEQWRGGAVTPATDQFAYCIALWEALSGERPYGGPTLAELRSQSACGPAALDASRIPRRLRGLLRRGLDPEPARRWPSMDALLARLVRARRRPGVALALGGGAVIAAALVMALRPGDAPAPLCEPPARDVATVWSPAIAAELRAGTSAVHEAVLAAAFGDWQTARAAACTAPPQVRQAQLQCLDGVLGRFDALREGHRRVPGGSAEDLKASLVDAAVCRKPAAQDIPRLTLTATPSVVAAWALLARVETDHKPSEPEIAALLEASSADPCARVVATLAFHATSPGAPRARALMTDAIGAADQCGDERLRADLMIQDSPYHWELPMVGPRAEAAIKRARTAAARVMQPELEAALAGQSRRVTRRRGQWDEAFRWVESELSVYRARGLAVRELRAAVARNALRIAREQPGDLEAIIADVRTWRPIAAATGRAELAREFDILDAKARFQLGDVAAAHADLVRLWRSQPRAAIPGATRRITGEVVDARGRPVAGALVAAASTLYADSSGVGLPAFLEYFEDDLQIATSDAVGRFAIEAAALTGAIAAHRGDHRSRPAAIADRVRLVLEPTRSVTGKVELGRSPHTRIAVYAASVGDPTGRFAMIAPVARDGTFELAGVPVGAIRLGATTRSDNELDERVEFRAFPASPAPLTGVTLPLAWSTRTIDVIVRSAVAAPVDGAEVIVIAGRQTIATIDDFSRLPFTGMQSRFAVPVSGENAPPPVLDQLRPGDLIAHVEHASTGELTVCALSFTGDLMDPAFRRRVQAHFSQLSFKCKAVGPAAAVVVLDVPPQQRFD